MADEIRPHEEKPPTPPSKDVYLLIIGGLAVAYNIGYGFRRFTGLETGDAKVN